MIEPRRPSMRPQPMISVADVETASRWYQQVLGATSGHSGPEYEQLLVDGELVMQLHQRLPHRARELRHRRARPGLAYMTSICGVVVPNPPIEASRP